MKKIIYSLFVLLFATATRAQSDKKLDALFLGNSYTSVNNLPLMIANLANSGGDTLEYDSNVPGGATFQHHATNSLSLNKINSRNWDFVILQAQSQEPSFPPYQVNIQTLPYAIKLNELIIKNDSCTKVVFYETWGRKFGDASNCAGYPPVCTYIGMQDRLKESYKLFADTCKAIMAPVGEAWRKSIASDPALELYSADQSHPSLEGSYLTACVFYEVLYGKSVVGNSYTAGLLNTPAAFLQQIAHDVVNDSLGLWNIGKYEPCATTTSVGQNSEKIPIVYPNPVTDQLHISTKDESRKNISNIVISDMTGVIHIYKESVGESIDVSPLASGMYIIRITSKYGKQQIAKFVKQ